ncbi:hypothetical protein KSS87_002784 [Heliosperma pusillum]|nr:hypothetical protein KSS87_002784 [Heliosperma pusillum]
MTLVKENEIIEQSELKNKKAKPFQTKCRPGQLVELIDGLTNGQKKDVIEIGFGGLLHLKVTKVPHGIMHLILKAFDHTCDMFRTKKMESLLTKDDVYDIFQLPRGGKQCNEHVDEFRRLFVMFSLSGFLAPTSNKTLDLKLVKAVENVESIPKYDWCDYVFMEMREYFGTYLTHHWNDKDLLKRVGDEKKTGRLGSAPISKIEYPISRNQQVTSESVELTQNSNQEQDDECEEKDGYLMVKLPNGVKTDEQIKARSIDRAHELYLCMKRDNELFYSRYVDNMKKISNLKQKHTVYEEGTFGKGGENEDVNAEEENDNTEEHTSAKEDILMSQTQNFLRGPDYHAFVGVDREGC